MAFKISVSVSCHFSSADSQELPGSSGLYIYPYLLNREQNVSAPEFQSDGKYFSRANLYAVPAFCEDDSKSPVVLVSLSNLR